ncbi:MAG: hybrid sensor histidine kinase/response regulator [Gemmatimonadota bacterium]|nr:MAG: hybrid sensor histidine kinase/response regulator [Gemmatimonadota bacterium]
MGEIEEQDCIVVIDDDYAMRLSCRQTLSKSGYPVEVFEDGAQGLEGVARLKPALVLVDLKMPGLSGMEVIARIHEIDPNIVIVVITGYATIHTAVDAMKAGAYDFLPKPFKPDELRLIVRRGLERRRLHLESRQAEIERELLKRRFVTFVSHQLKSPLAAIHQYLDILKRLGDTEETRARQGEWLDRCLVRSRELQQIINDWLTLASVEGETFSRQRVEVDLNEVVSGILKAYEKTAEESGVSLHNELLGNAYLVRGDRNCLSVLFDNLIINAIKYNKPSGCVTVSGMEREGEVVIEIKDTGIGIPDKYREFLFDEFFRVKNGDPGKTAGTGLGLPICKRIVSELGGSIEVESTENIGSVFRVRLPAFSGDKEAREHSGEAE